MTTNGALDGLEALVLDMIVYRIGPKNAAALACASTRLRSAASDDNLWSRFCADDFDLSEPIDPDGNVLPSFKEAYKAWVESFKMYPLELVKRAKRFWTSMRKWLAENLPEALDTLNRGASENQIKLFERTQGINLPLPTRVLYRFCNGQLTLMNRSKIKGFNNYGMMGGYEFYSHYVNVHLLPLEQVVIITKHVSEDLDFMARMNFVLLATSLNLRKMFFLDCNRGQLYVGTQNLTHEELMPCVPGSLVKLGDSAGVLQDGLMVWLEEHLRRLQSGAIGTRILRKYNSISLFPEAPPLCSTAVTNGVKVRVSAVLVPEGSNPGGLDPDMDKYLFAYSIRISLLPQGCMLDGAYYSSCQLRSRHWIIRSRENIVDDVAGEAVIGQYPLLLPGMDEFVYESCARLPAVPGSIEGSFTFVPGRISKPEGREFEVRVALFVLEEPHYIF
ncbi:F-box protein SKIP16 [Rhynchospora pubera]|uniref:F-box protein SKIP16 n=1 Tax=Rhynchospora pubera TaxID=906938 RepID=A0AAV8AKH4_9POAL|nr:F-box protein SKIP16 [Rhynchospora pubera]KAJ4777776.1 F-box protein SKIP16 [Rhynchospora pubera]KAJ4777777.1 F-box protein SKIP16 [Rhynchospora pubera]